MGHLNVCLWNSVGFEKSLVSMCQINKTIDVAQRVKIVVELRLLTFGLLHNNSAEISNQLISSKLYIFLFCIVAGVVQLSNVTYISKPSDFPSILSTKLNFIFLTKWPNLISEDKEHPLIPPCYVLKLLSLSTQKKTKKTNCYYNYYLFTFFNNNVYHQHF